MRQSIKGMQPFQILASNFSIGPSNEGYTLQISADGRNFSDLFTVPANTTRMVTSVANGSTYRLNGNNSEVVVNWERQCSDGGSGGGSYILPVASETTLGGVMIGSGLSITQDGKISVNGDNTILKSIQDFPESAETGDVVAVNIEGQGLPNGILFEERNDLGDDNDKSGGRFQFPIGGFADATQENPLLFGSMTAPDNTNYDMYLFQDEWGLSFVLSTDGDMYDSNFMLFMSVGSDMAGYNMYSDMVMDYHYTESTDEYYVVDIFPETTGSVSFDLDITEGQMGVYQYDGTDWNQLGTGGSGGVLVVNSLSSSEAAQAPVGSLIGVYNNDMPYCVWSVSQGTVTDNASVRFFGLSDGTLLGTFSSNSANAEFYTSGTGIYLKTYKNTTTNEFFLESTGGSISNVFVGLAAVTSTGLIYTFDGHTLQLNWSRGITFNYAYNKKEVKEHNLYMKVSGGTVANWRGYQNVGQTDSFEIIYDDLYDFTSFCDGKIMFSIRYQYGSSTRYAFMDAANQAIVLYSDSGKTTEVIRLRYLDNPVRFDAPDQSSSRNVLVEWKEDGVYFYDKKSMTYIENLIDFHTDGVHFSRITDPTKATASDLGLGNNTTDGIPIWNNEGVIVNKRTNVSTKTYFINSTGTTDSKGTVVLTTGANTGPNRFYAPEAGGTAGQILLSNGDNVAPVWSSWIKSVKITSDAYDALVQAGTTDPNTLYLIVDE